MPGLLLCFVLRYDAYKKSQMLHSAEAGIPAPKHFNRITLVIISPSNTCRSMATFIGTCRPMGEA